MLVSNLYNIDYRRFFVAASSQTNLLPLFVISYMQRHIPNSIDFMEMNNF